MASKGGDRNTRVQVEDGRGHSAGCYWDSGLWDSQEAPQQCLGSCHSSKGDVLVFSGYLGDQVWFSLTHRLAFSFCT